MDITPRQIEIIEAAGKLLTTGGISNLTTKNLANEMNFSEAALYRHFKSKDEIIIAMLLYLAEMMYKNMEEVLSSDLNAVEQLKHIFKKHFTFFNNNKHFIIAVFSEGLWAKNENIKSAVKTVMSVKRKTLEQVFQKGIDNNEFTPTINRNAHVHITMGTFRLHLLQWKMNEYNFDLVAKGDELMTDLLKLIATK